MLSILLVYVAGLKGCAESRLCATGSFQVSCPSIINFGVFRSRQDDQSLTSFRPDWPQTGSCPETGSKQRERIATRNQLEKRTHCKHSLAFVHLSLCATIKSSGKSSASPSASEAQFETQNLACRPARARCGGLRHALAGGTRCGAGNHRDGASHDG